MKKNLLNLLLVITVLLSKTICGATFTSNVASGSWNVNTSWTVVGADADGIPDSDDDVTITAGQTITTSVANNVNNLTVDGILSCLAGSINMWGTSYIVNAGGSQTGSGYLGFRTNGTIVSGSGSRSGTTRYTFFGSTTIAAGATVTTNVTCTIYPITVTNNGTMKIHNVFAYAGATFINGAGGSLEITYSGFMAGRTFTATAVPNTVTLSYYGAAPVSTGQTFNNLIINAASTGTSLPSTTTVTGNLTINTGRTLACTQNLNVGGNWVKNGTLTQTDGTTITFNGSAAQTINGTGTTTFKGLGINNTAGVSIASGTYLLNEVLTLSNGTLNTGGFSITMVSTAAKTARIAPVTGTGAITGNFTIERFISTRDTTYADFSSPVQSTTFLDWDNELPAISYSAPPAQASASTYNEAANAYVSVTSSATTLNPGQGFEIFLSGDFNYANLPNTTMTTVGVPTTGDQNFSASVSNTVQGWNLVGNPFASSIAWSSVYTASGGAASGMWDYIEMYDYTIQDWAGYTSASGIEIGSTQGFWVYGLAGPMTLLIPESSKTTSSNSSIKNASIVQPYFNLKLSNASSNFAHNFKVATSDVASDGLDTKDIPFRPSLNKATPQMYCEVDGKKININNFNSLNDSYSIPLKTKATVSGNYKLEASGFDFVDYTCIKLQDNLTGKIIDLDGNPYCFTMNSTDNPDRFILMFSKDENCKSLASTTTTPSVDFSNQIEVLPTQDGNAINFNLSETVKTNISVRNILGQTIVESISVNAGNQSVNITLPEGFSGLYLIYIESEKGSITKKFVKK